MTKTVLPECSGTIASVDDCGTIVIVSLRAKEGWLNPVFFDHGSFRGLLDGEGCTADDLIGRDASYDGQVLRLDDEEEAA